MGLKGFGITEEIFEKYRSIFFLLINPTYTDYKMEGEQAQKFAEVFVKVRTNKPNKQIVGEFLSFEPIQILWDSVGSEDFKSYGNSDELKDLLDQEKMSFFHYLADESEGEEQKKVPYNAKNFESIRKHL